MELVSAGSTFHFTIDAAIAEAGGLSEQVAELRGLRILVVDDNEANIELLLERKGM